ncbi:hypothetical protein HDR60_05820 [bacterium]|nr:hypothetical protein [bacterium]
MADSVSNKLTLFSSIKKWIFFIFSVAILTYLIINTSRGVYTLLTECWVCSVVENIYDAFSRVSYKTFELFQNDALLLLSVALALWIVYETYQVFFKGINSKLDINITPDFFKNIYKKLFLAVFVIGALLMNSPRNVFSNTYELVLDFGSGIGRTVLRKKINQLNLVIPDECESKQSSTLVYKEGMALSENTKDNMVCLIKEVNLLRQNYIQIGINLFEYALPSLITAVVVNVSIRVAGFIGGKALQNFGTDKWLKKINKKIEKQSDILGKQTDSKKAQKLKANIDKLKEKIEGVLNDIAHNDSKNVKRTQRAGRVISDNASNIANVSSIVAFITSNDIRMGLTGITLVIGLFMVNMLFAFIIVENMLFMGVSLLIFPFLAVCYVFNETRSYATAGLSKLWGFAKGLIFVCIAIIICNEINDWVLGGMFSAPNETNISTTKYALKLLENGEIEEFNNLVGNPFYFLYAIFAIILNFKIISEAPTFAGWFGGSVSESALGKSVWNFSKSVVGWTKSASRELVGYKKRPDDVTLIDKAKFAKDKIKDRFSKSKEDEEKAK